MIAFADIVKDGIGTVLLQHKPVDLLSHSSVLANLTFIYHTMKASEHLLEVAAERAEKDTPLHRYYVAHLDEERQHEQWLAEDLWTAGVDVSKTVINRQAVEIVGTQYYLVHHVDPVALLGYLALMELHPLKLEHVESLERLHGKKLTRTLRYHAVHDIDHGADLIEMLNAVQDGCKQLVLENALQSARYFGTAMDTFA